MISNVITELQNIPSITKHILLDYLILYACTVCSNINISLVHC